MTLVSSTFDDEAAAGRAAAGGLAVPDLDSKVSVVRPVDPLAACCPTARQGCWAPGPGAALFDAIEQALGRLPVVAEVLGAIMPDVPALCDRFDYRGMRTEQEAFGGTDTHEVSPPQHVPDSLAGPSSHDSDTAHGWWATPRCLVRSWILNRPPGGTVPIKPTRRIQA